VLAELRGMGVVLCVDVKITAAATEAAAAGAAEGFSPL